MRSITKIVVAAALSGGLLLGAAGPASAEVLAVGASGKATIVPVGAPAGAKVSKATVTVKKGAKTVARNKASYRAKPGTYKVTSKFTYRPVSTTTISADRIWAKCRVSDRQIISDRTTWNDWFDGNGYYAGQVTVSYSGSCTDTVFIGSSLKTLTWNSAWTDDEYIVTSDGAPSADWASIKLAQANYTIGDIAYVSGPEMTSLPTVSKLGSTRTTTRTRTVSSGSSRHDWHWPARVVGGAT